MPVTPADGSLMLRRGKMAPALGSATPGQDLSIPPRGQILELPSSPYLVNDRAFRGG